MIIYKVGLLILLLALVVYQFSLFLIEKLV